MNDNHFKFSPSVLILPLFSVLLIWTVFWVEIRFHFDFGEWGIYPRTLEGLRGVFFSPFIHGNIEHLYNNSIPLLILVAALRFFYREHSLKILGLGILISGLLTWIIGRESFHIGASGLIYVLVSFIFFKGMMTKYYRLVALSLLVVVVYGSLVWYVFPNVEEGISWEGHLAGLVTGFVFAISLKTPEYKKMIKYDWEKPDFNPEEDKFLQRFDADGNFVNLPKEEPVEEFFDSYFTSNFPVLYQIMEKKENNKKANDFSNSPDRADSSGK
ncbi:MAG: rhomboid family intramembrane serine protease [Flavobacterium sp.]